MPKVDDAVRRIKEVEMKKQARRERQISESKQRRQVTQKPSSPKPASEEKNTKRGLDGTDATEEPELKKPREEKSNGSPVYAQSEEMDTVMVQDIKPVVTTTDQAPPEAQQAVMLETSKPAGMTRGHTSFLTFALLLPLPKP
jgi:tRNA (adenine57-N1/adenine58-N1)-methyltransferase